MRSNTMKTTMAIAVFCSFTMVWLPDLKAQQNTALKNSDSNIEAYSDLLKTNVREGKAQILAVMMQFTQEEASVFWPIYQNYNAQLATLQNQESNLFKDYAKNSGSMTDSKANELSESQLTLAQQRNDLLKKVYEQVKAKLGATTAARFLQIEQQLLLITDLKLAAELPTGNQY